MSHCGFWIIRRYFNMVKETISTTTRIFLTNHNIWMFLGIFCIHIAFTKRNSTLHFINEKINESPERKQKSLGWCQNVSLLYIWHNRHDELTFPKLELRGVSKPSPSCMCWEVSEMLTTLDSNSEVKRGERSLQTGTCTHFL